MAPNPKKKSDVPGGAPLFRKPERLGRSKLFDLEKISTACLEASLRDNNLMRYLYTWITAALNCCIAHDMPMAAYTLHRLRG